MPAPPGRPGISPPARRLSKSVSPSRLAYLARWLATAAILAAFASQIVRGECPVP